MNTRIEVPLTLPPPHFEDDATIATARQVVPLKGARRLERRRKLFTLAPLLLASTLCGALGAGAVNYYQRRNETSASATQSQTPQNISAPAKTEPSPAPSPPHKPVDEAQLQAAVQPANSANEQPPGTSDPKPGKVDDDVKKTAPPAVKSDSASEPGKLIRKRRVQPAEPEATPQRSRRNGAGRIEDLFGGPNP